MRAIILFLLLASTALAQPFNINRHVSGAAPWTPLSIDSCVVWLDASDSTTIAHSSQRVSAWRDKSPYMHDGIQATAGLQPLLVYGAQNSKPGLYFQQSRGDLLVADSVTYASHYLTAFVVASLETGADAFGRILALSAAGAEDYDAAARCAIMLRDNGTQAVNGYRAAAKSTKAVTYATGFQGASIWDGTNHTTRINGSAGTPVSSSGLFSVASPSGGIYVGGSSSLNGKHQGYIHEVIIYKAALSASDIAAVEAYLKAKWGTP